MEFVCPHCGRTIGFDEDKMDFRSLMVKKEPMANKLIQKEIAKLQTAKVLEDAKTADENNKLIKEMAETVAIITEGLVRLKRIQEQIEMNKTEDIKKEEVKKDFVKKRKAEEREER